jgi:UPF0716 protein FxsA
MLPLLLIAFIVIPLAELYVIIQVGQEIGAGWTIALLLADSVLGSMLWRSQGRAVWRRFNAALAERRPPTREVVDGALVILGGALLITPGFLTDIAGVFLLLPPTRAIARGLLLRNLGSRLLMSFVPGARRRRPGRATASGVDVEGTGADVDPRPPARRP